MNEQQLAQLSEDIKEIKASLQFNRTVFNPKDAAKYLGIALSTLYKLTSSGVIPFSKPNGKNIYFSRSTLDEWMTSNQTRTKEQTEILASTYVAMKK